MDAEELARITGTLVTAIAEAKARAKEYGIDSEFRELVRPFARDARPSDRGTDRKRTAVDRVPAWTGESAGNTTIEQLEALAEMPDRKMR